MPARIQLWCMALFISAVAGSVMGNRICRRCCMRRWVMVTFAARKCFDFPAFCLARRLGNCWRRALVTPAAAASIFGDGLEIFLAFFILGFKKVRDVEKCVAFQADFNKCLLLSRKHSGLSAFIDLFCEGVFVFAFEIDFS